LYDDISVIRSFIYFLVSSSAYTVAGRLVETFFLSVHLLGAEEELRKLAKFVSCQ
jgi:hypothetical protein